MGNRKGRVIRKRSKKSRIVRKRWQKLKAKRIESIFDEHNYYRKEPNSITPPLELDSTPQSAPSFPPDITTTMETTCNGKKDSITPLQKITNSQLEILSALPTLEKVEDQILHNKVEDQIIHGRRIVDTQYLLNTTSLMQSQHSKNCPDSHLRVYYETIKGLTSEIMLKCNKCTYVDKIYNENSSESDTRLTYKTKNNLNFIWATYASASSYTQACVMLNAMGIPTICYKGFYKMEEYFGECLEEEFMESVRKAGEMERKLAIEKNQISEDGTPWIQVHCDGGWSKRTYGHSFNAQSGVAVIIGYETKKIVFLGTRNKCCKICTYSAKNNHPKPHKCYKNFAGPSYAMEPDIIVDGFNRSVEMHGIKYLRMVADGDSCTFSKVRREVPYGEEVEKIECVNHLIKNFGKRLYKLKTNTKLPVDVRKLLTVKKIAKIQQVIMQLSKSSENFQRLKEDILNVVDHVYENHENCHESYCDLVGVNRQRKEFDISGVKAALEAPINWILSRTDQFFLSTNNNAAELYMSILSKYICGKRINFSQRGSYNRRAYFAGLMFNDGHEWQKKFYNKLTNTELNNIYLKKVNQIRKTNKRPQQKKEFELNLLQIRQDVRSKKYQNTK